MTEEVLCSELIPYAQVGIPVASKQPPPMHEAWAKRLHQRLHLKNSGKKSGADPSFAIIPYVGADSKKRPPTTTLEQEGPKRQCVSSPGLPPSPGSPPSPGLHPGGYMHNLFSSLRRDLKDAEAKIKALTDEAEAKARAEDAPKRPRKLRWRVGVVDTLLLVVLDPNATVADLINKLNEQLTRNRYLIYSSLHSLSIFSFLYVCYVNVFNVGTCPIFAWKTSNSRKLCSTRSR